MDRLPVISALREKKKKKQFSQLEHFIAASNAPVSLQWK